MATRVASRLAKSRENALPISASPSLARNTKEKMTAFSKSELGASGGRGRKKDLLGPTALARSRQAGPAKGSFSAASC